MKALVIALVALAVPVRAHAKGCHEVSNVVGYEKCSWFGMWSGDTDKPPLWVEIGYFDHHYTSDAYTLDHTAARATDSQHLSTTAMGAVMRVLYGRLWYVGLEGATGTLTHIPAATGMTQPLSGGELDGHVIAGAHVTLWRFTVGAEVAAGGRAEGLSACAEGARGCKQPYEWETHRELELRAHADVFVTPLWSIGVLVGGSAIESGDRELLITTGFHMRALDGAP